VLESLLGDSYRGSSLAHVELGCFPRNENVLALIPNNQVFDVAIVAEDDVVHSPNGLAAADAHLAAQDLFHFPCFLPVFPPFFAPLFPDGWLRQTQSRSGQGDPHTESAASKPVP